MPSALYMEMSVMKVEIKHWDDSKKKTTPIVFIGQPERTLMRYIRFLDDIGTKKVISNITAMWKKLP